MPEEASNTYRRKEGPRYNYRTNPLSTANIAKNAYGEGVKHPSCVRGAQPLRQSAEREKWRSRREENDIGRIAVKDFQMSSSGSTDARISYAVE